MRAVTRIVTYVVLAVIHSSGSPNPTIVAASDRSCLSFAEAEELGLSIDELREEYIAAVMAFPDHKDELAAAWSELQYTLRDRLEEAGFPDLGGRSFFSVVLFEPDGSIARVIHRGLEPDDEPAFCRVVEQMMLDYRFPLHSEHRFSQCGTTHFGKQ
jgi:hypothetical protein